MKTAKLFMNGRSQAVRLPKEFRFQGGEVFIRRAGSAVVLYPTAEPGVEGPDRLPVEFMGEREQPSDLEERDSLE